MTSKAKVSILICVYNGEEYIKDAIDSAIAQTLEDIEIIVIDDGSTDSTLEILNSYSDERIRIFTQENRGLGASRNRAMSLAEGEYIAFLDADDWLDEKMCQTSYNSAKENDTDMTMFQIISFDDYSKTFHESDWFNLKNFDENFDNRVFTPSEAHDVLFDSSVSACQKIYRNLFLKSINASFPEGIYFEDMPFFYHVFLNAKRINIIRKHLYIRRKHDNSITEEIDAKFLDTVPAGQELFKRFIECGFYEDYKFDLIAYKINGPRMALSSIVEDYRDDLFDLIKEDYEIVKKSEYYDDFLENLGPKKRKFFLDVLKSNSYSEFKECNDNIY